MQEVVSQASNELSANVDASVASHHVTMQETLLQETMVQDARDELRLEIKKKKLILKKNFKKIYMHLMKKKKIFIIV